MHTFQHHAHRYAIAIQRLTSYCDPHHDRHPQHLFGASFFRVDPPGAIGQQQIPLSALINFGQMFKTTGGTLLSLASPARKLQRQRLGGGRTPCADFNPPSGYLPAASAKAVFLHSAYSLAARFYRPPAAARQVIPSSRCPDRIKKTNRLFRVRVNPWTISTRFRDCAACAVAIARHVPPTT